MSQLPQNKFLGAPTSPHRHGQAARVVEPLPVLPVSAREWPTLTIYRDGLANLNGLATELLRACADVALVAPAPVQRGRLPKAWQLHGDPDTEALPLIAHGARVTTRFRALAAAKVLFAPVGPAIERLSFALTPEPGHPKRYRLLPL